jgi:hypothetical protein
MSNKVIVTITRADGTKHRQEGTNLRLNSGINWQATLMGGAGFGAASDWTIAGRPTQLCITEDTTSPSVSMTSLHAEEAADGLSRTTGSYTHTADQSSYTLSADWQYTGGSVKTIATAGIGSTLTSFEASISLDTHFCITAVSPVAVLNSNDTLSIDWGIFY